MLKSNIMTPMAQLKIRCGGGGEGEIRGNIYRFDDTTDQCVFITREKQLHLTSPSVFRHVKSLKCLTRKGSFCEARNIILRGRKCSQHCGSGGILPSHAKRSALHL